MKKFDTSYLWWLLPLTLIVLRLFVFDLVTVSGHSMDPTLADKEKLVVYKHAQVKRFDTVIVRSSEDDSKNLVKRVIGLPGDTVEMKQDTLFINGKKYKEPYLESFKKKFKKDKLQKEYSYSEDFQAYVETKTAFTEDFKIEVPKGQYFVLGDNRPISHDGRAFGPVESKNIKGVAKFVYWPFKRFGTYQG